MLPLSVVATIFIKLWSSDRVRFFEEFLSWSSVQNQENIRVVLQELPVVEILVSNGWDRELGFLSQEFRLLGAEFRVCGLLFYAPCVAIFCDESVAENMERLGSLAPDYPLARLARNIFSIFYQTTDAAGAVEDLIEMTLRAHILVEIESMVKVLRRIQWCNWPWKENLMLSHSRVPVLCEGWVRDTARHFEPCWWRNPKPDFRCVQCRPCKAAIVLFMFCNPYYDDMHQW